MVVARLAPLLALVCACGSAAPARDAGHAPEIVLPSDARIAWIGRSDRRDPAVARFAWPATAFSFRIRIRRHGGGAVLRLRDVPRPDDTPDVDWVEVRIDGGAARVFRLRAGDARYPVTRGLGRGTHVVAVAKRTEAEVGTIELRGIELLPGAQLLAAPGSRPRTLVVLGDSVSAGFGDLGPDASCPFSAATQNALAAYSSVAADAVDADLVLLAWSGKGVLRNADPREPLTLPAIWERTLPDEETPWSFEGERPDAVVVNLGANDFLLGSPDRDAFVATYARLLDRLRARYGDVPVLLVLSPMIWDDATRRSRTDARAWLEAHLATRRAAGEMAMELVDQWADPAEGLGCQMHPNVRAHARLGRELAGVLRVRLGIAEPP